MPHGLKGNVVNPQYIEPRPLEGTARNAGRATGGAAGEATLARIAAALAAQPVRAFGDATAGDDSLSVRGDRGRTVANLGGLYGLAGDDRLEGHTTDDRLFGGPGDDELYGRSGSDLLVGDAGRDVLEGGAGADLLDAGPGDDRLNGGLGNDLLAAGRGNDRVTAVGGGRDRIDCGPGRDTVTADRRDVVRNCERRR